jgi:hypothetical protein
VSGHNYDGIAPTVLYDIFWETKTSLTGLFVALYDQAYAPDEKQMWLDAMDAINAERKAINPDDRAAQIAAMERWSTEEKRLRAARAQGQTQAAA